MGAPLFLRPQSHAQDKYFIEPKQHFDSAGFGCDGGPGKIIFAINAANRGG